MCVCVCVCVHVYHVYQFCLPLGTHWTARTNWFHWINWFTGQNCESPQLHSYSSVGITFSPSSSPPSSLHSNCHHFVFPFSLLLSVLSSIPLFSSLSPPLFHQFLSSPPSLPLSSINFSLLLPLSPSPPREVLVSLVKRVTLDLRETQDQR